MRTIIVIDPHKSSLTAIDDRGTVLGTRRVTVNKGTGTALLKMGCRLRGSAVCGPRREGTRT
jgi:hypothetical protein